tara:strand:- start:162 stop:509 length:348 start_codon:yes stop_codon:yes gene_type:complete
MGNINQAVCGSVKPHLIMNNNDDDRKLEADTHNWILPAIRWNQQVEQYDAFLAKNPNVRVFTDMLKIHELATIATPDPEPKPDPECCEHCNLFDVFSKGLCQGCFEDQYSDGARW